MFAILNFKCARDGSIRSGCLWAYEGSFHYLWLALSFAKRRWQYDHSAILSQDQAKHYFFLVETKRLYMRVCPSIRRSVRRSIRRSVGWWHFRQKRENRWFWSKMMSHVISSSYNHFIIMRMHRWPYGPCLTRFEISEVGML